MNKLFLSLSVFCAPILVACQTTPFSVIDSERTVFESELPASWTIALEQSALPQDWVGLFDDPILNDYLMRAERENADTVRAVIRVRQAEAALRETRSILLPTVRSGLQGSGFTSVGDIDLAESLTPSVSASWDPGLFGRNDIEINQSEALLDVSRANAERIRRVVMAQTARAYIQVIEADSQLALARDNLDFIGETLRISEARFNLGDIARDSLALAQLQFANAEANVMSLELSTRDLRRSLAVLIGQNPDAELVVADRLPQPVNLALSLPPADILARRFDVTASRARIMSQFTAIQRAERLNWPSLTLSGSLSGGGATEDLFDVDSYVASLGASLAGILFDGGRKDAAIDNARAGLDIALIDYDEVLRNAIQDVESGFDRISTARRSLAALERGSEAANKALELEKIKFDLGESIVLDVLEVQRQVNAILASNIATNRRLLDAQIDTYLALGG